MRDGDTPSAIILQEARRKFIEGGMRRGAWADCVLTTRKDFGGDLVLLRPDSEEVRREVF